MNSISSFSWGDYLDQSSANDYRRKGRHSFENKSASKQNEAPIQFCSLLDIEENKYGGTLAWTSDEPIEGSYGKARIITLNNGWQFLRSYETIVASKDPDGYIHRYWDGWSPTTARHLKAFGMWKSKAKWYALPEEVPSEEMYRILMERMEAV